MSGIIRNIIKTQTLMRLQNPALHNIRNEHTKIHGASHRVNGLEKRFLVWTGKYKSLEEVPPFVGQNVIERTRNKMRIRIANCMMAATAIGCLVMVYFGKQAAGRGESVAQQNLDWHRQYNQDHATDK